MKQIRKQTTVKDGLHALLWQEGDMFVAKTLEVEIASQGKTKKQALKNLQEAIELYFEEDPKPLQNIQPFQQISIETILPDSLCYA